MTNTYIVALIESLEKKIAVLKEIRVKNKEQEELLKEEPFSFDKFDKNTEEKGVLIFRLNKLDEGFESLYNRVKDELNENRSEYTEEITHLKELISEITSESASIEAEEARNKARLENVFKLEKNKIKSQRSNLKAAQSYAKAMAFNKLN